MYKKFETYSEAQLQHEQAYTQAAYTQQSAQIQTQYQIYERILEKVVEKRVEVLPDVDRLMRLLWETDPEVIAFVQSVSDYSIPTTYGCIYQPRLLTAGFEKAWERNEPKGSKTRALIRADRLLTLMSPEQTSVGEKR